MEGFRVSLVTNRATYNVELQLQDVGFSSTCVRVAKGAMLLSCCSLQHQFLLMLYSRGRLYLRLSMVSDMLLVYPPTDAVYHTDYRLQHLGLFNTCVCYF
jgi:hypothetical protein